MNCVTGSKSMVLSETDVYFSCGRAVGDSTHWDIMRVSKKGGESTKIATLKSLQGYIELVEEEIFASAESGIYAVSLKTGNARFVSGTGNIGPHLPLPLGAGSHDFRWNHILEPR